MARKRTRLKRPRRPLGPKALAQAAKRKTDRKRPGHRPGEDERIILRRSQAISLRLQGATFRQIAAALGCAVGTAHEDVTAELMAVSRPTPWVRY